MTVIYVTYRNDDNHEKSREKTLSRGPKGQIHVGNRDIDRRSAGRAERSKFRGIGEIVQGNETRAGFIGYTESDLKPIYEFPARAGLETPDNYTVVTGFGIIRIPLPFSFPLGDR